MTCKSPPFSACTFIFSDSLTIIAVAGAKEESTDPNPAYETPVANNSADRLALTVLSVSEVLMYKYY